MDGARVQEFEDTIFTDSIGWKADSFLLLLLLLLFILGEERGSSFDRAA